MKMPMDATFFAMVMVIVVGTVWLLICHQGIKQSEKALCGVDYLGVGLVIWTFAFFFGAIMTTVTLIILAFG